MNDRKMVEKKIVEKKMELIRFGSIIADGLVGRHVLFVSVLAHLGGHASYYAPHRMATIPLMWG